MKKAEKLGELAEWDMNEEAKKAVIGALLGTEMETDSGNPSQYAKFLSVLETGLSVDGYLGMCAAGGDVNKYLKYAEAGLDPEEALQMVNVMGVLNGSGEGKVTDLQRWRAAVDSQSGAEDQLTTLSAVMDDKAYRKAELANKYGVKPDAYVEFRELLPKYDEDENQSYSQKGITAAVDAISGSLNLTTEQKAALWQIATGSKSAKNNPYSVDVGWNVIDALSDESLSFGELFMRQVMANT